MSLRWPQVDLRANVIDFEIEGRERTKKQRGKVPIPPQLIPHLRRARRRGSDLGPVLHISGRPIANIKKGFAAACRRAGIKGVTPHTMRHTAATWLMQNGVKLTGGVGISRHDRGDAAARLLAPSLRLYARSRRGNRAQGRVENGGVIQDRFCSVPSRFAAKGPQMLALPSGAHAYQGWGRGFKSHRPLQFSSRNRPGGGQRNRAGPPSPP